MDKAKRPPLVKLPKGASLSEVKVSISQELDCCADSENIVNALDISTPDGGGGKYLVLEGRWAMDDEAEIDGLAEMLKDLLRRVSDPIP